MAENEWTRILDGLRIGDHAILLYNDFGGLYPPVIRFMTQGLQANELVVVLLPVEEIASWRDLFDEVLSRAQSGETSGSLQIIPLLPSRLTQDTGPLDVVSMVRRLLKDAEAENRTGVRVVARLAPALLDKGYDRNAIAIEKFAAAQRFPLKTLCLYEAAAITKAAAGVVQDVVGAHTHSIAHVSQDVYLAEVF